MITKVGSKAYEGQPYQPARPRLSVAERSLLKWAVIDREDKVLDAGLGNGTMVEYIRRNMECEVCGVSDDMELVRRTRELVRSADIVYASDGDIPWRDAAFDTVLLRARRGKDAFRKRAGEIRRVLKDGGQLVLGVHCCPPALAALSKIVYDVDAETMEPVSQREARAMLKELGFEQITWQRTGLFDGVLIGWKENPKAKQGVASL